VPDELERRATLIYAIARGRRWLDELVTGRKLERRLPRRIGVEQLRELPLEWERQLETLGLNPG